MFYQHGDKYSPKTQTNTLFSYGTIYEKLYNNNNNNNNNDVFYSAGIHKKMLMALASIQTFPLGRSPTVPRSRKI